MHSGENVFSMDIYRGMSVIVYIRKSEKYETGKQVQSVEDQLRDCMEIVERWGLVVVETIIEKGSAWEPHKRPKFKCMLKELSYKSPSRRRAEGIVAWHPNRLARNALEAGMIVQMLDDELIKNLFFSNAYHFTNTTSGKEHLTIEFARAKGFNDNLSEVVSRGLQGRELRGGMSSYVKFGYMQKREDKDNPKLCSMYPIPHPEHFQPVKRSFELALEGHSTDKIVYRLRQEFPEIAKRFTRTVTDERLKDSFYCGIWVICKGKKNERIVDLSQISLPDGTCFTPAVSKENFELIQRIRSKNKNSQRRKHSNPLAGIMHCGECGKSLYASRRKIKRSGGIIEEQLGYECHHKHEGITPCKQPRVKGELIFEQIASELEARSQKLTPARYKRYLLAVHHFTKKKQSHLRSEKARIQTSLTKLEEEKRKLVMQRAELISAGLFDADSKEVINGKITTLTEQIQDLRTRRTYTKNDGTHQIITFHKFLELRANLVQYWKSADDAKKTSFGKIILWNLTIKGQELAQISFKKPFSDDEEGCGILNGAQERIQYEPSLCKIWDWLDDPKNDQLTSEISNIIDTCKPAEKLKYPLISDIEKISGTKV